MTYAFQFLPLTEYHGFCDIRDRLSPMSRKTPAAANMAASKPSVVSPYANAGTIYDVTPPQVQYKRTVAKCSRTIGAFTDR